MLVEVARRTALETIPGTEVIKDTCFPSLQELARTTKLNKLFEDG